MQAHLPPCNRASCRCTALESLSRAAARCLRLRLMTPTRIWKLFLRLRQFTSAEGLCGRHNCRVNEVSTARFITSIGAINEVKMSQQVAWLPFKIPCVRKTLQAVNVGDILFLCRREGQRRRKLNWVCLVLWLRCPATHRPVHRFACKVRRAVGRLCKAALAALLPNTVPDVRPLPPG